MKKWKVYLLCFLSAAALMVFIEKMCLIKLGPLVKTIIAVCAWKIGDYFCKPDDENSKNSEQNDKEQNS